MWTPGDKIYELEQHLENDAIKFAKRHGIYTRKYKHPGRRAAPDHQFIYRGKHLYVEFKRQRKEPTEQQWIEIGEMRDAGAYVVYVDAIEDFLAVARVYYGLHRD